MLLVQKSVIAKETFESRLQHGCDNWQPPDIEYVFTAWAQCSNERCKQDFAIAGDGGVDPELNPEDGVYMFEDVFLPKFCDPMPEMIELSPKCPANVREELCAAFRLFWRHHGACAGRVRVGLEYLMDHLGVPRRIRGSGKSYELSLHARVEVYAKKNRTIGPQLMALKWLGNVGSHATQVERNDLLDALEIMEHALAEIIEKRSMRVNRLTKALTRKYGKKRRR